MFVELGDPGSGSVEVHVITAPLALPNAARAASFEREAYNMIGLKQMLEGGVCGTVRVVRVSRSSFVH